MKYSILDIKEEQFKESGKILADTFKSKKVFEYFFKKRHVQKLEAFFEFILNYSKNLWQQKGLFINNQLVGLMIYGYNEDNLVKYPFAPIIKYIIKVGLFDSLKSVFYSNKIFEIIKNKELKQFCYLYYLCIAPNYQKNGLSKVLMEKLFWEVNRLENCTNIILDIDDENLIEYYQKYNFKILFNTKIHNIKTWLLYWTKQ